MTDPHALVSAVRTLHPNGESTFHTAELAGRPVIAGPGQELLDQLLAALLAATLASPAAPALMPARTGRPR